MNRQAATSTKSGQAIRIDGPKSPFSIQEVNYPSLQGDQILLKVSACGICHSDSMAVEGSYPGLKYPIVPGHEIAGSVESTGPGVVKLKILIAADGHVEQAHIVSGHPLLVQAAKDAVSQWQYKPTLLNGEPVEVVTTIEVNFTLSS